MPVEPIVSAPHTIVLKGRLSQRHEEKRAGGAINPGYLLSTTSTGTVVAHATAGANWPKEFAKEDTFEGGTITTAFASNDVVPIHIAQPGDMVYVKLAASATAVVKGDGLTSAGNGTVKKWNGTTDLVIGYAEETVDNSGGSTEAFLRMRVN